MNVMNEPRGVEQFRSRFHLTPPFGWMNDPNGFSWYDGAYHLLYQFHPFDTVWGPMHWGHAVSSDLVTWEHLPPAIAPSEPYDHFGCFSGTACEHKGEHVLLYTGVSVPDPTNPGVVRQVQCLAVGDGKKYHKHPTNPVIGSDLLPDGASLQDFRDPKLWHSDDSWNCLVASRGGDGTGQLLLFRSPDLTNWSFVGVSAAGNGKWGKMWECPDWFRLGEQSILLWSIQDLPTAGSRFQNVHSVVYAPAQMDGTTGAISYDSILELDSGSDFYAAQTLQAPDGRLLLVAWLNMWERSNPSVDVGLGWAGTMTIPRELSWKNGRIYQQPVSELATYRGSKAEHHVEVSEGGRCVLPGVAGQHLDLELQARFAPGTKTLAIAVFVGEDCETLLTYDASKEEFRVDRSRSGLKIDSLSSTHPEASVRRVWCPLESGVLRARVLLDRSSLEIFLQDGAYSLSFSLMPPQGASGVDFLVQGSAVFLDLESWTLRDLTSKEST